MNNSFKSNNSEDIGIDPTTVEVIDVLDLGNGSTPGNPNQNKEKSKSKGKELLTKILFAFGVLLLMGIVAFGVYFYLNLGKKKTNENQSFKLENQRVYVGAELSDSVFDYGDFSKIDVSGCSIDKSKVDTSTPGEYEYSMVCNGSKYTAKITVIEKFDFEVTTKVVYKNMGSTISASDFIEGKEDYKYAIINEAAILDKLYTTGGPYVVEISLTDAEGKKGTAYSYLYITESVPVNYLKCELSNEENENYKYSKQDTLVYDSFRNYLDAPSRIYTLNNLTDEEYLTLVNSIKPGGEIEASGFKGYAIRDDQNMVFSILSPVTTDEINAEAKTTITRNYTEAENYYKNKGYICTK